MKKLLLFLVCFPAWAQNTNLLTITPTPTLTSVGEMRWNEKLNTGANYFGISAPDTMSADVRLRWPATVPAVGDCMIAGAVSGGKYPLSFGVCGGSGLLSTNNTWTGTNTFAVNDLILQRATETTSQSILFQNLATPMDGNWKIGVGDSTAFPGLGSAIYFQLQGTTAYTFEGNGDAIFTGSFEANAVNATVGGVFPNLRFGQLVGNTFASPVYLDASTGHLTNIANITMTGTLTGASTITANDLIIQASGRFDQGVYLRGFTATPSFSPPSGYGGLLYHSGSTYRYWDGAAYGLVDFSTAGFTTSLPIQYAAHVVSCPTCFTTAGGQTVAGTSTFGDINAANISATATIGAHTVSATTVRLSEIRFGGLSNTLLFDGATANLTNINNVTMAGTLTGLNTSGAVTFNVNSPTFLRSAGTYQRLVFDEVAGTVNDWTFGIEDSVLTPAVGDSAFIVKNNGSNLFVLETGSSGATFAGPVSASAMDATTGTFSTVRMGELRYSGFANTLFLNGATGNLTNIGSIGMTGALTGATSITTGSLSVTGTSSFTGAASFGAITVSSCTGCGSGLLSTNNTWTGTNTFSNAFSTSSTVTFNVSSPTLARLAGTYQRFVFDAAGGVVNDWTVGIEDSVLTPGVGDSAFIVKNNGTALLTVETGGRKCRFFFRRYRHVHND
jgi:hypothetical protein